MFDSHVKFHAKICTHNLNINKSRSGATFLCSPGRCNGSGSYVSQRLLSNPDLINEFFAAISTTNAYNDATVWSLRADLEQYESQIYVNGYELEPVLRRLKNTAPGCDGIPAWVYRNCSFELADVIACLLYTSPSPRDS